MNPSASPEPRRAALWVYLLVAIPAAWLCFAYIGDYGPGPGDERRYFLVAYDVYANNEWIAPRVVETPYFRKPPLLFWLMAISHHLFGEAIFWARFPSAVAGFLLIMLLTRAAGRISNAAALAAPLVYLATFDVIVSRGPRNATMEALLSLFMFAGAYVGLSHREIRSRIMPFLGAAGYLVKGGWGFFVLLPYWLSRTTWKQKLTVWLAAVAMSFWWFIAKAIGHTEQFLAEYIYSEHLQGIYDPSDEYFNWYVYFVRLALWQPGITLVALAMAPAAWLPGTPAQSRKQPSRLVRYAAILPFVVVVILTIVQRRYPRYLNLFIPLLSLVAGYGFHRLVELIRSSAPRWQRLVATLVAAVVTVLVALGIASTSGVSVHPEKNPPVLFALVEKALRDPTLCIVSETDRTPPVLDHPDPGTPYDVLRLRRIATREAAIRCPQGKTPDVVFFEGAAFADRRATLPHGGAVYFAPGDFAVWTPHLAPDVMRTRVKPRDAWACDQGVKNVRFTRGWFNAATHSPDLRAGDVALDFVAAANADLPIPRKWRWGIAREPIEFPTWNREPVWPLRALDNALCEGDELRMATELRIWSDRDHRVEAQALVTGAGAGGKEFPLNLEPYDYTSPPVLKRAVNILHYLPPFNALDISERDELH